MKGNCEAFKKQIESILERHGLLTNFRSGDGFHHRFESKGFMPLVVERHGDRVMVTHYFEQNGDLIPDPDMEMLIATDGEWYPVAIQFATGHYLRARTWDGDRELVDLRQVREQVDFSRIWAANLKCQGF